MQYAENLKTRYALLYLTEQPLIRPPHQASKIAKNNSLLAMLQAIGEINGTEKIVDDGWGWSKNERFSYNHKPLPVSVRSSTSIKISKFEMTAYL
jgi:hypothetical protein